MQEATHVLTPFGWPVVIYLALAGVAAGCALLSAWALLRGDAAGRPAAIRGFGLATGAIALGGLALVADLEAPGRFWLILAYFNPGSMIAWGARIITLFGILGAFAWAVLRRQPNDAPSTGMRLVVGSLAILALAVALYPGWVLPQAAARPLWGSPWIAPLFLVSAIHAGLAASLLLNLAGGRDSSRRPGFGLASEALLVIAQAMLLATWFLTVTSGYPEAASRITGGELAVWLWGGVVLLGWLLPLGLAFARDNGRGTLIVRAGAILLGALALRTVIVFGGQGSAALLATLQP